MSIITKKANKLTLRYRKRSFENHNPSKYKNNQSAWIQRWTLVKSVLSNLINTPTKAIIQQYGGIKLFYFIVKTSWDP